jgi:hypothetical protein
MFHFCETRICRWHLYPDFPFVRRSFRFWDLRNENFGFDPSIGLEHWKSAVLVGVIAWTLPSFTSPDVFGRELTTPLNSMLYTKQMDCFLLSSSIDFPFEIFLRTRGLKLLASIQKSSRPFSHSRIMVQKRSWPFRYFPVRIEKGSQTFRDSRKYWSW